MAKISNFQLGTFVIAAMALLVVMLYYLGMSDLFVQKAQFTTFFTESVQGLSEGAQVKYKGAQIGSVERIIIHAQRRTIQVDMSVELKRFRTTNASHLFRGEQEFYSFLEKEVHSGLRCRLEYAGITGLRYVDLDYFGSKNENPAPPGFAVDGFMMPSVPSVFRDIAKSLNTSLERISKVRFEEISDNLVRNLNDLNQILTSDEIQKTLAHLRSMAVRMDGSAAAVSGVLTADRMRSLVERVEAALVDIQKLASVLRRDVEKCDIAGTSASIRRSADTFTGILNEHRADMRAIAESLVRTMDMFRELADNLNQDPASLIRGRQ